MELHAEIQEVENKAYEKRLKLDEKYDLEAQEKEIAVCEMTKLTRGLFYYRRSKIIDTIPCFWLTAFLGHYALGVLLSEEDQMIFRFLKSVNVEDTEGGECGYIITFNFATNPYFENESLAKKLVYTDEGVEICGCIVNWKDGIVATSGNQQAKRGYAADGDTSFFTLFFERDDALKGVFDEVANVIINDLWPNAVKYYVNGNFTDEEEVAIEEDCQYLLSCCEELRI
ncbi:hypothetical protein MKW94_011356 [Papaver nudicaule]|uniref:Nucleosome assembly protein n=1 Tax=Papaver nudicaule TaxID=74823 RepID=A0AA41VRW8_PAPNU|nr:hypothetical protein [Papaver nudicaule]